MDAATTLSSNIASLRKSRGLSQNDLGKKLGVSSLSVSRWERGDRVPRVEQLDAIAGALRVQVSSLFR